MPYLPAWQRSCDCRCPLHYRQPRTTYDDRDCACTVTCATQPVTLVAEPWGCALFLDQHGNLWHVPHIVNGAWDWENAGQIDSRSEFYDVSVIIEHLMRLTIHVLGGSTP